MEKIKYDEKEIEEMVRKLRNQTAREWRAKNKDKVREINIRYWINRAKKELEKENKNEINN